MATMFTRGGWLGGYWTTYADSEIPRILQTLHDDAKAGMLERLTPTECLNRYATSIQSNRRNLLLVAGNNNFPTAEENKFMNGSHVYWSGPFYASDARTGERAADAYNWICSAMQKETACSSNVNEAHNSPGTWKVGNNYACESPYNKISPCQLGTFPVEYCLSQKAEPHCRLQFDTTIAILVTVLNLSKFFLDLCHSCIILSNSLLYEQMVTIRPPLKTYRSLKTSISTNTNDTVHISTPLQVQTNPSLQ
jgi:hypothetical protein